MSSTRCLTETADFRNVTVYCEMEEFWNKFELFRLDFETLWKVLWFALLTGFRKLSYWYCPEKSKCIILWNSGLHWRDCSWLRYPKLDLWIISIGKQPRFLWLLIKPIKPHIRLQLGATVNDRNDEHYDNHTCGTSLFGGGFKNPITSNNQINPYYNMYEFRNPVISFLYHSLSLSHK